MTSQRFIGLGRYLYRGLIREKDIVSCDDGQERFRYQNAKTGRMEQPQKDRKLHK